MLPKDPNLDIVAQMVASIADLKKRVRYLETLEDPFNVCEVVEGRLTLTSALPITVADVLAATTIYFTPYLGNLIALYNGSTWELIPFVEISVAVPATTVTPFDVFAYDSGNQTLVLETEDWLNDTTRNVALVLQNGVYVKAGNTTHRYIGTLRTTSVNGQTEDSNNRRFCWNYYNRVSRFLDCWDTTNSWVYTLNVWRASNANTIVGVGRVEIVIGVAEILVQAMHACSVHTTANNNLANGIGIDATNANSAQVRGMWLAAGNQCVLPAWYKGYPAIGYHYIQRLENAQAAGAVTWIGDSGWTHIQGGMEVTIEG